MKVYFVSIFPEIFNSFLETSLIQKWQKKWLLEFEKINPRDFCLDKHRQVDDEIYGGGAGLLIKAEPVIQSVEKAIAQIDGNVWNNKWKVIYLSPSEEVFDQKFAHKLAEFEVLILVCGRYEGIDYRFVEYMKKNYAKNFNIVSMWRFVTMGGEIPSMLLTEAVVRLIPWIIHSEESRQKESYNIEQNMENMESPHYTRPEEFGGMKVPAVLLSGHHGEIDKWRSENSQKV